MLGLIRCARLICVLTLLFLIWTFSIMCRRHRSQGISGSDIGNRKRKFSSYRKFDTLCTLYAFRTTRWWHHRDVKMELRGILNSGFWIISFSLSLPKAWDGIIFDHYRPITRHSHLTFTWRYYHIHFYFHCYLSTSIEVAGISPSTRRYHR